MTQDNEQPSTGESSSTTAANVSVSDLRKPGYVFKVDGHRFITTGTVNSTGIQVLRLETGDRETLERELLQRDIDRGEFALLSTYERSHEVVVDRVVLATLADYAAKDVENFPHSIPDDVEDAAERAQNALE